jgi:membrane protease YdiL (CAAX protease family)
MPSQYTRMGIAVAAVAIWMAVGWIFHLGANAYLVFGIPYLLLFQLAVARRPVTELWLRDPSPRRLPGWTALVALLFMIYPLTVLVMHGMHAGWAIRFWLVGATLGALPLGWAVVNLRMPTWRALLGCFLTAGLWGVLVFEGTSALVHHGFHATKHPGMGLASNFLLYLPVCFAIEEVFFRGGLDSFVQRPGDRHYWWSAVLVSVLWGWWHLPASGVKTWSGLALLAVFYPLFHLPFGLWFSAYWRRSGNLLVPAFVHAFIDSVRNIVM